MTIERAPKPVDPHDPNSIARALYAENLELRDVLTKVCQELERLAGEGGGRVLADRAMRIRRRLWESKRNQC